MLRFDWNGLCPGDEVFVHQAGRKDLEPTVGVVAFVEPTFRKEGINGVGIRVDDARGRSVLWPDYLAVHRRHRPATGDCWRCDLLADKS